MVSNTAATSTSPELTNGLGAYIHGIYEYSDFFAATQISLKNIVSNLQSAAVTQNQTVLLPDNSAVQRGFSQLAEQYNITDPDTFFDRILSVANINYRPPGYIGGTGIIAGKEEAAGIVLYGFTRSHVLKGAYDFYNNKTILQAPYQSPVNVSTALTLPFSPHDSDLLAFGESTAPGPETVYLRAPLGLLNIDTGVPMPRSHLTAVNGTTTQYVYKVDDIFVFSGDFLPADVGVGCDSVPNLPRPIDCGAVKGALAQLAAMEF